MAKNKMNIPQIRFKGFEGEWGLQKLSQISTRVQEKNKDNKIIETFTNSAEKGIISQREFFDKDISNEANLHNYYVVSPNDFVYNPRISNFAPVGPIKRNKLGKRGVMSPLYSVFRPNPDAVVLDFLEYYFTTTNWHRFMHTNGDQGARSDRFAIAISTFQKMPIYAPELVEQTQIGNFFQQLDKLIELQTRAVESAETYKKAMLQKMFPQKGEKVPRVRFAGFSGDWEDYALHKITNRLDNLRKPVTASERVLGTTPYYGANGIQDYVQGYTHEGEHILVAEDGANNLRDYPIQYVEGKIWVNNHAHVLAAKASCDIKFLSYALKRINFISFLVGGGRAKLNAHIMMQIKVRIPKIEEQTAIGNFFQKLDQQIEQQAQKLATYQQLKKAMLQRMFV